MSEPQNKLDKNGTIAIKQGKLIVQDPKGFGRYPLIKPSQYVDIYIDGVLIEEEAVVNEKIQDRIEIKVNNKNSSKIFKLDIDKDGMQAYLEIELIPELKMAIKDQSPSYQIVVDTEIIKKKLPSISRQEIINYLDEHGIIFGYKEEAITKLVEQKQRMALVAEGKNYECGQDAKINLTKTYKTHEEEGFYNINSFVPGDVVAYKEDAVPGIEGINVKGEKILPPEVKDLTMKAGKGVKIIADGRKAIAEKSGKAILSRDKDSVKVEIIEQYLIEGDIDKFTGNINYQGELYITGNVSDYFQLKAGRDIKVKGNIANAAVYTGGNLSVGKNIISSKINLGNYLEQQVVEEIKHLNTQLKLFLSAIEQIVGEVEKRDIRKSNYKIGEIIRLLIKNKFNNLINQFKEIYKNLNENNIKVKEEFKKIIDYFKNPIKIEKLKDWKIVY